MTFWVVAWIRAFAETVLLELLVALPLLALVEQRRLRRAAAIAIANLATHPLVWFAFPGLAFRAGIRLGASEAWAVLMEAAVYRLVWPALSIRRAALVSLAANGASAIAGYLLARFGLRP